MLNFLFLETLGVIELYRMLYFETYSAKCSKLQNIIFFDLGSSEGANEILCNKLSLVMGKFQALVLNHLVLKSFYFNLSK